MEVSARALRACARAEDLDTRVALSRSERVWRLRVRSEQRTHACARAGDLDTRVALSRSERV